jgi:hypothetical protein
MHGMGENVKCITYYYQSKLNEHLKLVTPFAAMALTFPNKDAD